MIEAWLVEVGVSPDMVDLQRVKGRSVTHPTNQPTPPAEGSSSKAVKTCPTVASEKHPIEWGSEPPKKRKEMAQKLGKGASSRDEEEVPKEGMRTVLFSHKPYLEDFSSKLSTRSVGKTTSGDSAALVLKARLKGDSLVVVFEVV
ncbi:hypothetical protein B296_00055597 [Ensete ventricosum]|uniref:Uncharacterized protein n=1 Tax=Ensete ventricosum TaxID=4639 RepID=A0A426XYX1_ENSVE|nr:hypothetical protein B296_00055597 [Ensete ventricosum]